MGSMQSTSKFRQHSPRNENSKEKKFALNQKELKIIQCHIEK